MRSAVTSSATHTVIPSLRKSMPYDTLRDFTALARDAGQLSNLASAQTDRELKQLQSQAKTVERVIAELRQAIERSQQAQAARKGGSTGTVAQKAPFEPLRGKLPWPVQDGKVIARFGQSRAGGSMRSDRRLRFTPSTVTTNKLPCTFSMAPRKCAWTAFA